MVVVVVRRGNKNGVYKIGKQGGNFCLQLGHFKMGSILTKETLFVVRPCQDKIALQLRFVVNTCPSCR